MFKYIFLILTLTSLVIPAAYGGSTKGRKSRSSVKGSGGVTAIQQRQKALQRSNAALGRLLGQSAKSTLTLEQKKISLITELENRNKLVSATERIYYVPMTKGFLLMEPRTVLPSEGILIEGLNLTSVEEDAQIFVRYDPLGLGDRTGIYTLGFVREHKDKVTAWVFDKDGINVFRLTITQPRKIVLRAENNTTYFLEVK